MTGGEGAELIDTLTLTLISRIDIGKGHTFFHPLDWFRIWLLHLQEGFLAVKIVENEPFNHNLPNQYDKRMPLRAT